MRIKSIITNDENLKYFQRYMQEWIKETDFTGVNKEFKSDTISEELRIVSEKIRPNESHSKQF